MFIVEAVIGRFRWPSSLTCNYPSRRIFAPSLDGRDDHTVRTPDRRMFRSPYTALALRHQLDACRRDGGIEAMVIADVDGLPVACSGDRDTCDELAARLALSARGATPPGQPVARGEALVQFAVAGHSLLLGAAGGTEDARHEQLERGLEGARRILAA
ncbi:MAG TPA: hypothetical protein VHE35_29295 [Kofleriaceae bacterium]|nr:hypothetical protein [Kofleriaceae bacterium]